MVIEQIFGTNESDNYCYCLLEGDAVKDNGVLEKTFQFFLHKICLKYASLNFGGQGVAALRLRYEHVNNVATLADLFEITCSKFLDFLANHPLKNSIYMPFDALISEYNSRVELLLKFLTNPNYKSLTWPIPEMIDYGDTHDEKSELLWTLKYWNTEECFESVLKGQFFELIRLDDFNSSDYFETQLDEVDFGLVETSIFDYVRRLLKNKDLTLDYQLESSIESILKSMKTSVLRRHDSSSGLHLVEKTSVEWSKLLLPIVDYILAKGRLTFKNCDTKIAPNQFYIYYNMSELKNYDWVNQSNAIQSNYLLKTYPRQIKSNYNQPNKNQKRRLSEEIKLPNHADDQELDSSSENNNSDNALSSLNANLSISKSVKQFKRQLDEPRASDHLDDKLNQFLQMLNTEKENNFDFENRLKLLSKSESSHLQPIDNEENKIGSAVVSKETKDLESFLERLSQEKAKNEEFNLKLNKMLNYTQF
jgi:hypothetical protein